MPILKTITTPGGAALGWHVVARIEASRHDPNPVAGVSVHSWPTMDDYISNGGKNFTQVNHFAVPLVMLSGANFYSSAEQALVALQDTPLAGGSLAGLPSDLETAKVLQWAMMKQMRELVVASPIESGGRMFDADPASVKRIMGALQGLAISGGTEIEWTLADNTSRVLSLAELQALGLALVAREDACHRVTRQLRQQIEEATAVEAVLAVTWPTEAGAG